jgi:hypothetical protein
MEVNLSPGLYVWDVTLEGGETRQLLAAFLPTHFASPVIAATRGAAYPPGPPPAVAQLVPPAAPLGAPNFTLHVMGTGFRVGDVILWNGAPELTTLVSPTELTTGINMATATTPMPIPVAVRALSGAVSTAATFELQPAG